MPLLSLKLAKLVLLPVPDRHLGYYAKYIVDHDATVRL